MQKVPVGGSASWEKGQLGEVPGGEVLVEWSFTPSILDSEKMSQELLTPLMMPPQESGFFLFLDN